MPWLTTFTPRPSMSLYPQLKTLNLNILAIDPGLNNIGFSHLLYNNQSSSIASISAHTFKPEPTVPSYQLSEYLDDRTIKLLSIKDYFSNLITATHFDIIVCEAPFFYAGKPGAYRALVEVISIFKQYLADTSPITPFIQLEPLMVKRFVKSLNISNKDSTKEALFILNLHNYIDLNTLDEHSVDAISIGYAFLKSRGFLGV